MKRREYSMYVKKELQKETLSVREKVILLHTVQSVVPEINLCVEQRAISGPKKGAR